MLIVIKFAVLKSTFITKELLTDFRIRELGLLYMKIVTLVTIFALTLFKVVADLGLSNLLFSLGLLIVVVFVGIIFSFFIQ